VNGHYIFMAQIAGGKSFVAKPAQVFGVALSSGDLNGDRPIHVGIKSAIDAAKSATTNFCRNFVFPDSLGHNSFPFSLGLSSPEALAAL
jgi:hypothetical protein